MNFYNLSSAYITVHSVFRSVSYFPTAPYSNAHICSTRDCFFCLRTVQTDRIRSTPNRKMRQETARILPKKCCSAYSHTRYGWLSYPRVKQAGYGNCHGFLPQRKPDGLSCLYISKSFLIVCAQKDASGVLRHGAGYQRSFHRRP